MSFASLLTRWFGKRQGTIRNQRKNRGNSYRPMFERLEDRTVPSTLFVNNATGDTGSREISYAVQQAIITDNSGRDCPYVGHHPDRPPPEPSRSPLG